MTKNKGHFFIINIIQTNRIANNNSSKSGNFTNRERERERSNQ